MRFPTPELIGQQLHRRTQDWFTGDGTTTTFFLSADPSFPDGVEVSVGGAMQRPAARGAANDYAITGGRITFTAAPGAGVAIGVFYDTV